MWYCAESDSVQYHTARSRTLRCITLCRVGKLKCPKIQNSLTLRRGGLRAVWCCVESDSAQCDTAQSWTPLSVILRSAQSQTILFDFRKLLFPGLLGSIWWYFENVSKIFRKSKMANTAQSRTSRSVILCGGGLCSVLAIFWFSKYFWNILEISSYRLYKSWVRLRTVSHCAESHFLQISSRKRIFQRNHFRLFIRDPDGLD